jgi:hypothetical protein
LKLDIPTQEAIWEELKPHLPEGSLHVSGGLPDARGVSDVDIYLPTANHSQLLGELPEGASIVKSNDTRTLYSIPGFEREVNLYASLPNSGKEESVRHRRTMMALAEGYPQLEVKAYTLKVFGLKSEEAWARVLGLEGCPFKAMEDTEGVLRVAEGM